MSVETTTATAPATREINVNGRPLKFLVGVVKHGDRKGQPTLTPAFKVQNSPDLAEVMEWTAPIGQKALAKSYAKTIRSLIADACIDAVVKVAGPNGEVTYKLDDGKVVAGINTGVAELDAGTADMLRAELETLNKEFQEFFNYLLTNFLSKGTKAPEADLQKALRLTSRQAEIQQKIDKRSKSKAPKAAAPVVA